MKYLIIVNKIEVPIQHLEKLKLLGHVVICINESHPDWEGYNYFFHFQNENGMSKLRDGFIKSGLSNLLGYYTISFSNLLEIDHTIPPTVKDYYTYIVNFIKYIDSIERIANGSLETLKY